MKQKGFIFGLVLVLVLTIVLIIAGMVFLVLKAREALPSSWLYPIKAAGNKIEVWLTPGREAKAKILLKLADHEVNDIGRLVREKEYEDVLEESQELRYKLEEVREQAIDIEAVGKGTGELNLLIKNIATKALTALKTAEEQASGADKEKVRLEMSLLELFAK